MGIKADAYIGAALALVLLGVYVDRKYTNAGGASGIASSLAGVLWDNAAGAVANLGGSVLDALPSSQVPAVVDMAGPTTDTGTLLYESALMGGV
jgi:hypothetical protein